MFSSRNILRLVPAGFKVDGSTSCIFGTGCGSNPSNLGPSSKARPSPCKSRLVDKLGRFERGFGDRQLKSDRYRNPCFMNCSSNPYKITLNIRATEVLWMRKYIFSWLTEVSKEINFYVVSRSWAIAEELYALRLRIQRPEEGKREERLSQGGKYKNMICEVLSSRRTTFRVGQIWSDFWQRMLTQPTGTYFCDTLIERFSGCAPANRCRTSGKLASHLRGSKTGTRDMYC